MEDSCDSGGDLIGDSEFGRDGPEPHQLEAALN